VEFTEVQRKRLDQASATDLGFPHNFISQPMIRRTIFGNTIVNGK
jgi:hypothetical protein